MSQALRFWAGAPLALIISSIVLAAIFAASVPTARAANNSSVGLWLQDTDANAELDRIVLSIDNDARETWSVNGTPNFVVTQGGEPVTVSSVAISGSATADPVTVYILLDQSTTDVDTDGVNSNAVELAYVPAGGGASCANCLRDASGELAAIVAGDDSSAASDEIDGMAPRLVAQSPVNGAIEVFRDANVVMVFSEPINTSSASVTLAPGGDATRTWSVDNTTLTIDPTILLTNGTNTVSVESAYDMASSANAFGGFVSGVTESPWNFAVSTETSDQATQTVYGLTVTVPYVVEEWPAGVTMEIAWDWEGGAAMQNVNLYYSVDGGNSYTLIAKNAPNNGRYAWRLPEVDTDFAYIKVEGTDLVTVLASDVSAQFQIVTTEPAGEESDNFGVSPVTGETELITSVAVGDYIKSPYFDTVYYVDTGFVRRPFVDSQTYFTYQDSFATIKVVTDATLPTLAMGAPMLPNPGIVLIKIVSDDRVYAVTADGTGEAQLHWLPSETLAVELYGVDWSDYVIDIPVTLFGKYVSGSEVDSGFTVDLQNMKTRVEVNS